MKRSAKLFKFLGEADIGRNPDTQDRDDYSLPPRFHRENISAYQRDVEDRTRLYF